MPSQAAQDLSTPQPNKVEEPEIKDDPFIDGCPPGYTHLFKLLEIKGTEFQTFDLSRIEAFGKVYERVAGFPLPNLDNTMKIGYLHMLQEGYTIFVGFDQKNCSIWNWGPMATPLAAKIMFWTLLQQTEDKK